MTATRLLPSFKVKMLDYLWRVEQIGQPALRHLAFLRPRLRALHDQLQAGFRSRSEEERYLLRFQGLVRDLIEL